MFTIQTAAALTENQIELLTGAQLAAAYNALAASANVAQIGKFKDRPTGIKRLLPIVQLVASQLATKPEKKISAKTSVSAQIRRLINEGKTNQEILNLLDLDASKKHYPQWYRAEMLRKA